MKKNKVILAGAVLGLLGLGCFLDNNNQVKAAENCTVYTNYYFFSEVIDADWYDENLASGGTRELNADFISSIPADAKHVASGSVTLVRGGSYKSTSKWDLVTFWDYFQRANYQGGTTRTYTDGTTSYLGHGKWSFVSGVGGGPIDVSDHVSVEEFTPAEVANASILPTKDDIRLTFATVEIEPETLQGTVSRTFGPSDDVGSAPFPMQGEVNNDYQAPALYYIQYEVCEEEKYMITTLFKDNETKEEIKKKEETDRIYETGDKETISCPVTISTTDGDYKLVSNSSISVTITDKDETVECLYELEKKVEDPLYKVTTYFKEKTTGKELATKEETARKYKSGDTETITCKSSIGDYELVSTQKNNVKFTNSDEVVNCLYQKIEQAQTADILIGIVWFIGIAALGYGIHYYREHFANKE